MDFLEKLTGISIITFFLIAYFRSGNDFIVLISGVVMYSIIVLYLFRKKHKK